MVVLVLSLQARGQEVSVSLTVSPTRLFIGDTATLQVIVKNAPDAQPPEISSTQDYDIRYQGQSSARNVSMFNGRVRSTQTTTFSYVLVPRHAGRIVIRPIELTHGGKTYGTGPTTLDVSEAEEQDRVFVEVSADPPVCYLEQPVQIEVAVWLRGLEMNGRVLDVDPLVVRNPPELTIDWLDALEGTETQSQQEFLPGYLNENRPGFAVNGLTTRSGMFFAFDRTPATFMFPRTRATRLGLDGLEHEYFVYRFRKQYLPLSAGTLAFAPVRFKGLIPVEVTSSMRIRRTKKMLAFSKPLAVQVKPVPRENRPASFCGAVGRVDLRVSAKPTEVSVGDPITLTMRIGGAARLESVGAPLLAGNEALARDFRIPPDLLGGVMRGNAKLFTQTIRARSDEVTEVPPIEICYFDPVRERFVSVRSRAIPLTVHEASVLDTGDVIAFGEGSAAARLTTLSGGIQANYTDANALLASQQIAWSWSLVAGPLAGPALFLCVYAGKRRRDRLSGDVAYARRRRAYRQATRELNQIASRETDGQATGTIAACLLGYVADRCNRADGSMTRQEATEALRGARVEADLVGRLDGLLETCELARYARVEQTGDELVAEARRCLKEIEKCRF